MNIIEATKIAKESGSFMARAEWEDKAKIRPAAIGYDVLCCPTERKCLPLWNPTTEDILADDWVVC